MAFNPTGLLIIRAWIEPASSSPLRAHLRLTPDIATGITSEMTLIDISAVAAQVEAWLHAIVLNASRSDRDGPAP